MTSSECVKAIKRYKLHWLMRCSDGVFLVTGGNQPVARGDTMKEAVSNWLTQHPNK